MKTFASSRHESIAAQPAALAPARHAEHSSTSEHWHGSTRQAAQRMRIAAAFGDVAQRAAAAPIQMINVGYAPTNPGTFRTTTTIGGLGGTPASDKPFSNPQRANILANNVAAGGGAAPVIGAGQHPQDDHDNGALLDRALTSAIEPEVDHIVPRGEGGANDYSNARVLSKNNNLNGAANRPNNGQKSLRLYEAVSISTNVPGLPAQLNNHALGAGVALTLPMAQLFALYAGLAQPAAVTSLGQAGANQIKNTPRGQTNNGVTIA